MLSPLASIIIADPPSLGAAGIVLLCWPAIAIAMIYLLRRPARALVVTAVTGWLFLPYMAVASPFVMYDKSVALELSLMVGMLICYPRSLIPRLKLVDLPIVLWCIVPALSALANGLTFYEATAAAAKQTIDWGFPYLLARLYLKSWADARTLAMGIFIGGLVYVPFCVVEEIFQPFLHHAIYNAWQHQSGALQSFRDGGYRPMVFMQHGLAVALWMVTASLLGCWLWWTGVIRRGTYIPVVLLFLILLATTILTRSTGALILLPVGLGALYFTNALRGRGVLLALLLMPTLYILARTTTEWNADAITRYAQRMFGESRAQSFAFRMWNEREYINHDRAHPLLGYGPGTDFIAIRDGLPVVVDSYWIIELSVNGAIGVFALLLLFGLPVGKFLWRIPMHLYARPLFAAPVALAIVTMLYGLDNLVNAMFNPIFVMAIGCLGALSYAPIDLGIPARRKTKFLRHRRQQPAPAVAPEPRVDDFEHILAPGTISIE